MVWLLSVATMAAGVGGLGWSEMKRSGRANSRKILLNVDYIQWKTQWRIARGLAASVVVVIDNGKIAAAVNDDSDFK